MLLRDSSHNVEAHLFDVAPIENVTPRERLAPQLADQYVPFITGGMDEYWKLYRESIEQPGRFFGEHARRLLSWSRMFDAAYYPAGTGGAGGSTLPTFDSTAWFINGQLNACYNAVDRWAISCPDKIALIYEADEPGSGSKVTYRELLAEVCQIAQVLTESMGVRKGDTVIVYMPMIPSAIAALLAIARIGAIHSVVFAGYSSNSLRDRINDAGARVVLTKQESRRAGKIVETKRIVDEALKQTPCVEYVLVLQHQSRTCRDRTGLHARKYNANSHHHESALHQHHRHHRHRFHHRRHSHLSQQQAKLQSSNGGGSNYNLRSSSSISPDSSMFGQSNLTELDWLTEVSRYKPYCPCEPLDSEHPLFLLYTSGSTGTPKGVLHAVAGYLLEARMSMEYVFDVHANDVVFTAGDIGWVTGHTYVVYGPLLSGCTTVIFEGTPAYPSYSRYWDIIDRHKVTHFYVAPTALRMLKRAGDGPLEGYDLTSLRCLGTVGEPIAREVWEWYAEKVGRGRVPVIDTYWQTESGSHMIAPLAGVTPLKPGSVSLPFFGIDAVVLDTVTGKELEGPCKEGVLAVRRPWPSFARTLWRNHSRFNEVYFEPYPGYYFTGDGVARDKDGFLWILGRVDDVVNISGHRLSTAEIEAVVSEDETVAECAVVGFADELTGQAVAAFVVLRNSACWENASEDELQSIKRRILVIVRRDIGSFATPKLIVLVDDLPKTRSGKIMRRILRKILAGESNKLGDVSTLSNPGVVKHLIDSVQFK
ncbi:LAMI_0F13454g1_1 [Lachancea mirantina]|uniref:Acetyl-coenzyme A synthetase 1 n=1 Tax=Lachancea mirantina TaxID=1230905 RepID=A0A1G4K3Q7_9SACH|nr:LAMI_0F13454g1_1 [Lachancea mirantina]